MNFTNDVKTPFNNPFSSLRHKNFRYYWIGMCVSLIGTWMQNIAQPWLAYTLTKSPFLLSLIGAVQFTPILLFSLFSGVIIDKIPKKRILLLTQSASMIITLILAVLVFTGRIQYWHILIMSAALGIVNTFDMPARQAIVIELAGKEDLMNAIALNSMAFNVARIIGPALAGIAMSYAGTAFCFFANSISFAAVVIGLLFIKPVSAFIKLNNSRKITDDIKDGLIYIFKRKVLLNSILIMAVAGTFAPNFNVLVPVFAKEILKENESGFGILMSFMGLGSFLGAMFIATLSKSGPKKFFTNIAPVIVGVLLIITGYTNIYLMTGVLLAVTGFFFICFSSNTNSSLQLNTNNEYRGRVMSIYTLVFAGSTPIGNLYAGLITERFTARIGFAACGIAIIVLMIPLFIYMNKNSH